MLDVVRGDQCALTQRPKCNEPLTFTCGDAVDSRTGQVRFDQRELVFNYSMRGTELHIVYQALQREFPIGRVRLIRKWPEQGWGFHSDPGPRIHLAIDTQPGAFVMFAMLDGAVTRFHVPADGYAYWLNTQVEHGVLVGPGGPRIHMVLEIITPATLPREEGDGGNVRHTEGSPGA